MASRSDFCTHGGTGVHREPPAGGPSRRRPKGKFRTGSSLILFLVVLALCAVAVVPSPSRAPVTGTAAGDKIEAELDRTDQVIDRAEERLKDCADAVGLKLLDQARQLQEQAVKAWHAVNPTGPRSPQLVLGMTRKARDLALRAIETCVEPVASETLRNLIDTTQDRAGEVAAAVGGGADEAVRRLLDAGVWQLDKAREAYQAGQYRRAMTLASAARNLIQRAWLRSQKTLQSGASSGAGEMLDRTDLLLAGVRESAGGDAGPKVEALLDLAQREQDQARSLSDQGRPDLALRHTEKARAGALDALWLVQHAPDPARIGAVLDWIDGLLQEAAEPIRASASPEAQQLWEKAGDQLQQARSALTGGDAARAMRQLRAADALLRQARARAERG
jgi:hypothetical protein